MANRFPLIVNTTTGNSVQELPSGDFLDLSSSGISNSGNIVVSGIISATGNVSGSYFIGNGSALTGIASGTPTKIANGTSEANIGVSGGNANITIGGTSNVFVVSSTGIFTTGLSSVSGNITGGNVLTGGLISATGNITGGGHVGTVYTNSIINTGANGTGNIGSSALYFNTVFAKATSAQYADLAEMYSADQYYTSGTVVVFGGPEEITISNTSHDTKVAGIISTNPSYLMNSAHPGEHVLPVALTGRVPCRVVGPVQKGDRLVAGEIPGTAQSLDMSQYQPGCIIGKSLEDFASAEVGTIEVAVGRT